MQIVIDIPEDVIESAQSSPNYYPTYNFEKIWRAIANGTPLPKGHGRLIDADKANKKMQYYHDDCEKTSVYTRLGFETAMNVVNDAPTIIEADTESEDKE